MEVKKIKPTELNFAAYNPPARTSAKNLKSLKESIKLNGILAPVLIDSKKNIIDGHRRATCAKELNLLVPCIIINSNLSSEEQFETINSTAKKISTSDLFFIYLNGGVVPKKQLVVIKEIESFIGTDNLEILSNGGATPRILKDAKGIASYCKRKNDSILITRAVMWLFTHKASYQIRKAIEIQTNPSVILIAIDNNRSLKINYTA